MKRISLSTVCSQTQNLSISLSQSLKLNKTRRTLNQKQETPIKHEKQTDCETSCNLLTFDNTIFKACYQGAIENDHKRTKLTYHKLKYQSLNKNQKNLNKNQKSLIRNEIKTQSVKNSSDRIRNYVSVKINDKSPLIFNEKTSFQIMTSPDQSELNPSYYQNIPSNKTKSTLQSFYNISQTYTNSEKQQNLTTHTIKDKFNHKKHQNQRLSTLDSYPIKSYLQETVGSVTPHQLQNVSKLCQSLKIQPKSAQNQHIYQRSIKNKSFIRSLKDVITNTQNISNYILSNNYIQNNNYILSNQQEQDCYKNTSKYQDQQRKIQKQLKYQSFNQKQSQIDNQMNLAESIVEVLQDKKYVKQTSIQNLYPQNTALQFNRIKTLGQCGETIVSRYNKSSQKRSKLQESNIVFQASKMINDMEEEKNKIQRPQTNNNFVSSDGKISTRLKNNQTNKQLLKFGSFSQKNIQIQSLQILQKNQSNQILQQKIIPRTTIKSNETRPNRKVFLRSQKEFLFLKNQELEEIRFDLNTFVEYGPL